MKLHELKKWTDCIIWEWQYTFNWIDWMYGKWFNLESSNLVYWRWWDTLEELWITLITK